MPHTHSRTHSHTHAPLGCFYVRTLPANFLCFLQFWILDDACCQPRPHAAMSYAHRDSNTYLHTHTHAHTRATHTHARVFATTWKKFCRHCQMLFSTLFCLHLSGTFGGRDERDGAYFPTANFTCSKRKVLCVQIIELALVSLKTT